MADSRISAFTRVAPLCATAAASLERHAARLEHCVTAAALFLGSIDIRASLYQQIPHIRLWNYVTSVASSP